MEHTYNFIFMSCSGFDSRQRTSSQCVFDLLGNDHPLVTAYRRKLYQALY